MRRRVAGRRCTGIRMRRSSSSSRVRLRFTWTIRYVVAERGKIVIAPPNSLHGFSNTGADELRLTAIHTAAEFETHWAGAPDSDWASRPRETSAGQERAA